MDSMFHVKPPIVKEDTDPLTGNIIGAAIEFFAIHFWVASVLIFLSYLWDRNELTQFRCDGLPFREFVTPHPSCETQSTGCSISRQMSSKNIQSRGYINLGEKNAASRNAG
jgi:hypothetical protein